MRTRIASGLAILTAGLVLALGTPERVAAQKDKAEKGAAQAPRHLYGHDLRVRPGGETDFAKAVRIGVEVFQDDATGAFVAISEAGFLAVAPAAAPGADRTGKWLAGQDLSVRKSGEPEFTRETRKYGVEVFRDLGTGRLLYVCESASIAFSPVPRGLVADRGAKWHHALVPKVRSPGQADFTQARRFGMEVFRDENTSDPGGLIYITEAGALAIATAPPAPPDRMRVVPPRIEYGLVLRVRKAGEADFTETTKQVGVEVFADPNANDQLFYLTETGSVAVAPHPGKFVAEAKGVTWRGAMILKARKGGEKAFDDARRYGVEVFQDNRTGHSIFLSDTGAIAVLPKP